MNLDAPCWRPICSCAHPLAVSHLMPERWPHPCYIGATYLGCGWSWLYECQEWGEELELVACGGDRYDDLFVGPWRPYRCTPRSGHCFQYDATAFEHM